MPFKWYGDRIGKEIMEKEVQALVDAIDYLLDESDKTVPHDEGTLEQSGFTDVDGGEKKAALSYDTPYAVWLHEHPEFDFQGKGRGKWLELTMKEKRDKVRSFLADRIGQGW